MGAPRTPAEAKAFLEHLSPSVIRLGLDRVRAALDALGNPDRAFRSLHVAGTNGKGSTCAMADACLREAGHRVGLYTSPHLARFNERIRVGGEEVGDDELGQRVLEVLGRFPAALDDPPLLTYFELGTVVALWHFAKSGVEVAVLETGLGGRLDATNATSPIACALTPTGRDHAEFLGDTLAQIAGEKAGILKRGVPAVCARQPPEALEVFRSAARAAGAPLFVEGEDFDAEPDASGALSYRGRRWRFDGLRLALRGPHQRQNAAVALAALEALAEAGVAVDEGAIRRGLAAVRWPGRFEIVEGAPTVVFDGAHNPEGAQALARALRDQFPRRRLHLVFGVLADKSLGPMLAALFPLAATAHLAPVPSPRGLPPAAYADGARVFCRDVHNWDSPEAALEGALVAAAPEDVVVVAGSLYLVGALRTGRVGATRHKE